MCDDQVDLSPLITSGSIASRGTNLQIVADCKNGYLVIGCDFEAIGQVLVLLFLFSFLLLPLLRCSRTLPVFVHSMYEMAV